MTSRYFDKDGTINGDSINHKMLKALFTEYIPSESVTDDTIENQNANETDNKQDIKNELDVTTQLRISAERNITNVVLDLIKDDLTLPDGYDLTDLSCAIIDELDTIIHTEEEIEQLEKKAQKIGHKHIFFDKNSPIRQYARKILSENKLLKEQVDVIKKYHNEEIKLHKQLELSESVTDDTIENEVLNQEDMLEENARLDEIYPEYKGETINIDGVDRSVYNSNGDRIAKSEQALRNFYKWFGDSKVIDDKGRPLVVYHSTSNYGFNEFDNSFAKKGDIGFFFTDDLSMSKSYFKEDGKNGTYSVYLKIEKPHYIDFGGRYWDGTLPGGKWAVYSYENMAYEYQIFDSREEAEQFGIENFGENEFSVINWTENESTLTDTSMGETTREITNTFAKEYSEEDYDGIIFGSVIDYGSDVPYESPHNVYVAFNGMKYINKFNNTKQALQEIVYGAEESTVKDLRDDLSQYGGTNDITFVWGNNKKGLVHIVENHGSDVLPKIIDAVIDGKIKESYPNNKVIVEKNGIDVVLKLTENGKSKSWLITGYDTNISKDEEREFRATLKSTQDLPTFGRQELGAMLNDVIMTQAYRNVNPQIKSVDNRGTFSSDTGNIYLQGRKGNGFFDSRLKAIIIGSNYNSGTLPHEFAHFFLDKNFELYKSGKGTDAFNKEMKALFEILGVNENQTELTRDQQEM